MTRGEIWWVDFGVPFGSEVGFRRPVIVLQNKFAAFVQQIDKSKFMVHKEILLANLLFKTIYIELFQVLIKAL